MKFWFYSYHQYSLSPNYMVFLTGYTVSMVTYYAMKNAIIGPPMADNLHDTNIIIPLICFFLWLIRFFYYSTSHFLWLIPFLMKCFIFFHLNNYNNYNKRQSPRCVSTPHYNLHINKYNKTYRMLLTEKKKL